MTTEKELFEVRSVESLPTPPKQASESLRRRLRERADRDFYFFTKAILGYSDLNSKTHRALCRFLQSATYSRRMILMPRGTFKTTIATIAHSIFLLTKNPNELILIVADVDANAKRFLLEIAQHFEHNKLFRWVYSDLIPENFNKTRWSAREITVKRTIISRQPSVDAIGAMGSAESNHYSYIKADDLITEEAIRSSTHMKKVINWVGGLESLLVSLHDPIDFVGSHKKSGDLYSNVTRELSHGFEPRKIGPHATFAGELAKFSRSIIENGESIFEERIPLNFLRRLRKTRPDRYYAQYANSPRDSGLNTFHRNDLRYYNVTPSGEIICSYEGVEIYRTNPRNLTIGILFDPALAERESSSKNAIVVVAKGSHPFRIVLETKIGHYPIDEAVDTLLELDRKWRPTFVSIEKRGFQGSIKYWLEEKCLTEKLPFPPIVSYPSEGSPKAKWAKTEVIRAMQPIVRSNYLWLSPTMDELIEELETYPNVDYDDGLDALAQSLEYWPVMLDEPEIKKTRNSELAFLKSGGIEIDPSLLFNDDEDEESLFEERLLASLDPTGYNIRPFNA